MIRNGSDIADGDVVSTQICVVGSGPAGITVAWLLQKAGLKVTLIDGGRDLGLDWQASWPDKVKLYNGTADGLFASNEPDFLILPYGGNSNGAWERERVYGGTSVHWGGQSRPLDPITFEARPGFPGWPITRRDLDPCYAKAAAFCKLHSADFSAEYWAGVLGAEVPRLAGFDTEMYQFIGSNYLNFASRIFDGTTIGDSNADVILNANLLDLNHANGFVRSAAVASMNEQSQKATQFTIKADVFVLACGAVANARQLLLSNAGNEYDQVGRHFTGHPISRNVRITASGFLAADEMRLMTGQTVAGAAETGTWSDPNGVTVQGRFSPNAEQQRALGIAGCWFRADSGQYYFEMAPNDASRVTLADTRDPVFGQQQTRITWQISDLDRTTYDQTTRLFRAAVEARGGQVSYPSWDVIKSSLVVSGHHIGTTRMSSDPTKGVVDANPRVHSLANLYVAGSSVFPTAGISNPTFTIVALSIRLAEHLAAGL